MSQVKHKVISKSGGITIPAAIRREYNNFLGGEAVDIQVEDGKLVIAPHAPRCVFCDSIEGVVKYSKKYVCRACVNRMAKEVDING